MSNEEWLSGLNNQLINDNEDPVITNRQFQDSVDYYTAKTKEKTNEELLKSISKCDSNKQLVTNVQKPDSTSFFSNFSSALSNTFGKLNYIMDNDSNLPIVDFEKSKQTSNPTKRKSIETSDKNLTKRKSIEIKTSLNMNRIVSQKEKINEYIASRATRKTRNDKNLKEQSLSDDSIKASKKSSDESWNEQME